jgi:hypothetical protein
MPRCSEQETPGVRRLDLPDGSAILVGSAGPGTDHVQGVLDGMVEMQLTKARERLRRAGIPLDASAEERLKVLASGFRRDFEGHVRGRGIAPRIVNLLAAPSKRDAERLASAMTITAEQFSDLMFNAHAQLGYRHRMKWREFLPPHLEGISDKISDALRDAKPGPATPEVAKAMRKVQATMEERKRVHVHMLERGAKWHAFFFDLNDVTDLDHGPGPHLHYISHRWGIDREAVWTDFDERHQLIPRRVHIRFVNERLERAEHERRRARANRMPGPGHVLANDDSGFWFLPGDE